MGGERDVGEGRPVRRGGGGEIEDEVKNGGMRGGE